MEHSGKKEAEDESAHHRPHTRHSNIQSSDGEARADPDTTKATSKSGEATAAAPKEGDPGV